MDSYFKCLASRIARETYEAAYETSQLCQKHIWQEQFNIQPGNFPDGVEPISGRSICSSRSGIPGSSSSKIQDRAQRLQVAVRPDLSNLQKSGASTSLVRRRKLSTTYTVGSHITFQGDAAARS